MQTDPYATRELSNSMQYLLDMPDRFAYPQSTYKQFLSTQNATGTLPTISDLPAVTVARRGNIRTDGHETRSAKHEMID